MTEAAPLSRRRALGLLGGAAAAAVLPGCSGHPHPAAATRRTRPTPTAGGSRPPTAADWRALSRRLSGQLHRPGDTGYDAARLLFDRRFDGVRPQAVARVRSDGDIAQCLDFARRRGLPVRVRSGGHSYLGASAGPGLVLDLRSIAAVQVSGDEATVGAGIALVDAYTALGGHGVSIPAGSCPTVGLSGLALGGGIGVVARQYGLTCDRLVAATVVLADGTTVRCDQTHQPDLFWALRGGGGSFGVVTALTLRTHAAGGLAHGSINWPWSAAADVLAGWQRFAPAAPDALWSTCHLLATADGGAPPTVSVAAVYVGSPAALQSQLDRLVSAVPASPTSRFVASAGYQQTMLLEAGCAQQSVASCHVADEMAGGTLPRDAFVAGSDFFRRPIPGAGIRALVAAVEARQRDRRLGVGGAAFDSLGGAVDGPAPDATAYVHRGAWFSAQYTASWQQTPGNRPLARNRRSLAAIHGAVHRYADGEAYQNYPDATLADPLRAYYGANLPRLTEVRRSVDPTGVFTYPQGVPLV